MVQTTWCTKQLTHQISLACTSMESMFKSASSFNGAIESWNVSSGHQTCPTCSTPHTSFNQPLNNWDVSSVVSMSSTFLGAASFNQPLNNWDVSTCDFDMDRMFFDKPWTSTSPSTAGTSRQVTSMVRMFSLNTDSFNQPLNNWNVSGGDLPWAACSRGADSSSTATSPTVGMSRQVTSMARTFSGADRLQP